MTIHHASSGELIDVRPLEDKLRTTATTALFKTSHLEVSRCWSCVLARTCPRTMYQGEMTVQCLEGRVELGGRGYRAADAGRQLICLAGGATHSMKAIEDSSVLITMLLHGA